MTDEIPLPKHIRSFSFFHRRLDFTLLNEAVCKASTSKRIAFSDVDGVLERYGHVLFLEAKCYRGAHPDALHRGQEITLTTLAAAPRTSVLVLYVPKSSISGEFFSPGAVTHFRLISGDCDSGIQPADFQRIESIISQWVRHAEAHPVAIPCPSPFTKLPPWARQAAERPDRAAQAADADDFIEVLLHD